MIEGLLLRAFLAGLGIALAAGPLGALVLWRRMAFIGDAMAHAAVLGVAVSLALALPVGLGVAVLALLVAGVMSSLAGRGLAADSMLGVLAHSALAFGLVVASLLKGVRIDLDAWLFGDILAVGWREIALIWAVVAGIGLIILRSWGGLLTAILSEDMAVAAGLRPARLRILLMLCLAAFIAMGIKVVGALLVSAMLVLPASAARFVTRTPEAMAAIGAAIAAGGVGAGLAASWWADTPAGPSIVAATALALPLCLLCRSALGTVRTR